MKTNYLTKIMRHIYVMYANATLDLLVSIFFMAIYYSGNILPDFAMQIFKIFKCCRLFGQKLFHMLRLSAKM